MQSYRKISNQNTKKSTGIEGPIFNRTGEMEMDHFGCLNSSLSLFLFCKEPAKKKKKNYGVRTLTADSHRPKTLWDSVKFLLNLNKAFLCV